MQLFLLLILSTYILTIDVYANNVSYIIPHNKTKTDNLRASSRIAMSGMEVQSERLKIVSQNIANIDVTGAAPDAQPYRRKVIFFENKADEQVNAEILKVKKVAHDNSDFIMKYQPQHPAANAEGYVAYPNVNIVVETADAQEAQRSFNVNTNSMEIAKSMQFKVLESMK